MDVSNLNENGKNTITVSATDTAGNVSTEAQLFVTVKKKSVAEVMPNTNFGESTDGSGQSGGPYVNYDPNGGSGSDMDINGNGNSKDDWRLFYNDKKNVFLIAADYVKNTKVPTTAAGMKTYSTYTVYWDSIPGSQWSLTTATNALFMYSTFGGSEINQYNGRCVSRLLNTDNWTSFVNGTFADKVIGGSTLEMWLASWNAHEDKARYPRLITRTTSGSGFTIGKEGGSTSGGINLKSYNGYQNKLYWPHGEDGDLDSCYGYWLAAPAGWDHESLMCVNCSGGVTYNTYSNYWYAYRCAPRSSSKI